MNRIKGLVVLVAVGLLVYFITRQVYEPEARSETISSTVLLGTRPTSPEVGHRGR